MFPGDLNNDGQANHLDLLPLGVAYGQMGPPRFEAGLAWFPQETDFWAQSLPVSGVNLAFVDANGNGLIDSLDLDGIALNYDSVQMMSLPSPMPYLLTDTFLVEELPILELQFNRTEAAVGDTVEITIHINIPDPTVFPSTHPPVAVAFSITYDPSFINEEATQFVAAPDSEDLMFIGAGVANVNFGRSPPSGRIEFAAAGRGQGALAMSRPIGKLIIVIEDMILLEGNPGFDIDDPTLINLQEEIIELQTLTDGLLVTDVATPLESIGEVQVFPNPTMGMVHLCGLTNVEDEIRVYSVHGTYVNVPHPGLGNCRSVDLSQFSAGIYFFQIQNQKKVITRKVIKRPAY